MDDLNSEMQTSDQYAETDGMPIGESDTYLVSMVNSVESDTSIRPKKLRRAKADPAIQTSRRARLLAGQS